MKRKSIKAAILVPLISVLVVGIAIMITAAATVSSKTAHNMADRLMDARIDESATEFRLYGEDVYSTLKAVVPVVSGYINAQSAKTGTDICDAVVELLSKVLLTNDKVYAMWTCWEPVVLEEVILKYENSPLHDEDGRFAPYVHKSQNGVMVERLIDYNDPVNGEYYQAALTTGKPYVTDPYVYPVNGVNTTMYSFAIPILRDKKAIAVVGVDVILEDITAIINQSRILEDGYVFVVSPNGYITAHHDESVLMTHYSTTWLGGHGADIESTLKNGGNFNIKAYSDVAKSEVNLLGTVVTIDDTGRNWLTCGIVSEKTVKSSSAGLLKIIIVIGVILIVATCITVFFIVSGRLKRLPNVAKDAKKISEGNFDFTASDGRNDEIAEVSNALIHVKETIHKLVSDITTLSKEFAEGDIDAKIEESHYEGKFRQVVQEINKTFAGAIEDTMVAIHETTAFGDGNFSEPIKEMPGKKQVLTKSFKLVQSNLKQFNADILDIIKGASEGNLDISIDVSKYKGDWGEMAAGINGLLSAIVVPVREVISVLDELSRGNLEISVKGTYKGEFENMKKAVNNTLSMLSSYIKEITAVLTALSHDNLDQTLERDYAGAFSEIKIALNTIIDKYNQVISDISAAAEQVAGGAKQIAESGTSLAQGATEQASTVEELNTAIAAINESTLQNAKSAEKAKDLSDRSMDNAAHGDNDMNNMLVAMESIKEAENSISQIMKVIDEIAFQTNLLALNAAVEAARAGEQGKGFAVVAKEVRDLAGKSQTAAQKTATLIEESISRVSDGSQIAVRTAQTLKTIINDTSGMADVISDIAASSNEQAEAIEQVTERISIVASVIQNNSATSEEAASASQQLSSQAQMLRKLVGGFKLKGQLRGAPKN